MKKALLVYGGWEGHHPKQIADLFTSILKESGFSVDASDSLDAFADPARLRDVDLVVPHWSMGRLTPAQAAPLFAAVRAGTGVAGCHGMCGTFRDLPEWQFMTGGLFVSHPGDDTVRYTIHIKDPDHPITQGLSDFTVTTEQYYMHVDPANRILATTTFPTANGPHTPNGFVEMPVAWTRRYGQGRVFYYSLGHTPSLLASEPSLTLLRRAFSWTARPTP